MKRIAAWGLLFALLLPGCVGKKTEEYPPLLETGIASENASDFAVIGGELWVIEEGEIGTVVRDIFQGFQIVIMLQ